MTTYFISRQCYWPDGDLVVEIACGGTNYAGPDMFVERFRNLGEGQEFTDPREAVNCALNVANAWRQITTESVGVAYGHNLGFSMPFEPSTDEELIAWAEEKYEKLDKCDQCGELLGGKCYTDHFGELKFCSEYCAEMSQVEEVENE